MEEALAKISQLLKYPSDLDNKLAVIEKESRTTASQLESNLSTGIEKSMTDIQKSSNCIKSMNTNLKKYVHNFGKLHALYSGFSSLIENYENVKIISIAHCNFNKVLCIKEKLAGLEKEIECINILMKENKLLEMHYRVYALEEFKYEISFYAEQISRDSFLSIQRKINLMEKTIIECEIFLLKKATNFLEEAKKEIEEMVEEHNLALFQILKIVDKEEERDSITKKVKENMYPTHKYYIKREPKRFLEKFVDALVSCIKERFKNIQSINELEFVLEDLHFMHSYLLFSFKFIKEKNFMLKVYHKEIKKYVDKNLENLDAGEILFVLEYVGDYYNTLSTLFGISHDSIGASLLGDKEVELTHEYIRVASMKLSTWILNITNKEVEDFYKREAPPTLDEEEKFISTGFINLLQIIKQQLEPIAFNKEIFKFITKEVIKNCEIFQKEMTKAMQKDLKPSCSLKSKPGYEEYVIMVGNSGLKVTQYITSLPQCQGKEIRELGSLFIEILQVSNTLLSSFIINTLLPVLDKVFTEEWYDDDPSKVLIITIEDFLGDYKTSMNEYSFSTFIVELANTLTSFYLKQVTRRRALIYEDCGYRLKGECSRISDLLCKYGDKEEVLEALSPILRIVPLVSTSNEELFVNEVRDLLLTYPDAKKEWVKNLIKKRKDLSDAEKQSLTGKIRPLFSDTPVKKHTVFNKI